MVAADVATNRFGRRIATRFPPEPNGFLHIGHAKSLCLNFGIAREFNGRCNLRFDDTNPFTEDVKYVEAIKRDIQWLGFEWDAELYASDYFERLYEIAERLVEAGRAYVDSQSEEEIREARGTVTTPGTNSPYRGREPAENLDLLRRMRAGEFPDGAHVLRRDPVFGSVGRDDHREHGGGGDGAGGAVAGDREGVQALIRLRQTLEDSNRNREHNAERSTSNIQPAFALDGLRRGERPMKRAEISRLH